MPNPRVNRGEDARAEEVKFYRLKNAPELDGAPSGSPGPWRQLGDIPANTRAYETVTFVPASLLAREREACKAFDWKLREAEARATRAEGERDEARAFIRERLPRVEAKLDDARNRAETAEAELAHESQDCESLRDGLREAEAALSECREALAGFRKVIPIELDEDNQNAFDAALYRLTTALTATQEEDTHA